MSVRLLLTMTVYYGAVRWGVYQAYDGKEWITYTEKDGLARDYVISCAVDQNNRKWFGTYMKGVSCFDGKTWKTYTTEDGLADNIVGAIVI